ncbi:MAG: cytochrome c family protein, partial [Planctomycetes bacterium]|nr:cytochrome c family protein [Planctomycetota bacterium]
MIRGPWFRTRAALLALLGGALAAGAAVLFRPKPPAGPAADAPVIRAPGGAFRAESCRDCRSCHPRQWAEWSSSRHAAAWTNPLLNAFAELSLGIDDCVKCHAPAPVLVTGASGLPRERSRERETGVDCLTCHQAAGGIAGPRGNPAAPCMATARAELRGSAACKGCHRTIGLDWEESPAAAQGLHCGDCHMPEREKAPGAPAGRSHDPRGGHDPSMLRRGLALEARIEGREAVVSVAHRLAGHNVPGERHFRILFAEIRFFDPDGAAVGESRRTVREVTPIRKA